MMELCLLAVDDESLALSDLTAALQAAEPAARSFSEIAQINTPGMNAPVVS